MDQGEIGDGDDAQPLAPRARVAVAVAEGVELLDVAEREAGLVAHPAPQAAVEGTVVLGIERTEGQGLLRILLRAGTPGAQGEDTRHLLGHRYDHGVEAILNDGVPAETQRKVQSVAPKASFDWVEIKDEILLALDGNGYISRATFYRLALPQILDPKIDRILYLDSDLICTRDIAYLWHIDIAGYPIGAVCDPGVDAVAFARQWGLAREPGGYFNAGVLLLDLELIRGEGLFQTAIDFLTANRPALEFMDQDALNYALSRRWAKLDPAWNVQRNMLLRKRELFEPKLRMLSNRPAIIHYTGDKKPWLEAAYHPYAALYWRNLARTPFWKEVAQPAGLTFVKSLQLVTRFGKHWPFFAPPATTQIASLPTFALSNGPVQRSVGL